MIVNAYRNMESDFYGRKRDSRTLLGQLEGCVLGGESASPMGRNFPGVISTEGQIGIRRQQASGVIVRQGDYLEIVAGSIMPGLLPITLQLDGSWWKVQSMRQWDFPNTLTGTLPDYYWVDVVAASA
ncbi:hypothetical protein FHR72_003857 [Mycolicibacterium iranicum]|uniref:Uncharacterized protein n=1 Tax=Mycolicibacterium iranicum TaxID=912594 RepID=A0A839Q820_MYCIR|nr:hypothetical protein [Mycolicibacterium iranicum]MBB2992358.1 hypothetical protein [Mycolicibacterium iranicum]